MQFTKTSDIAPPKNGNLLLLLVAAIDGDDDCNPTRDSLTFITIGFNAGDDNGEDEWFMAGWDECGDEFTSSTGEIIGWLELPEVEDVKFKGID